MIYILCNDVYKYILVPTMRIPLGKNRGKNDAYIPSYLVERGSSLFCVVKNIQNIRSMMRIIIIESGFHYNYLHV